MSSAPAISSKYAVALLASLIGAGLRDVVVCPGSRSQALALAAAEAELVGAIRLHVRIDERSAGFFALGVARETGRPAAVIVTSGGAVANLMPAVVEAHEGRVPMLLLTADRPAALRGSRSNQTTRQAGLFGQFSRLAIDLDVAALGLDDEADEADEVDGEGGVQPAGPHEVNADVSTLVRRMMGASLGHFGGEPAGPVQLNLQFIEPLSGWPEGAEIDFGVGPMAPAELFAAMAAMRDEVESTAAAAGRTAGHVTRHAGEKRGGAGAATLRSEPHMYCTYLPDESEMYLHDDDRLTVVVAGEYAGDEAEQFAHDAGLPLLAEVVSGVRYGREAIATYAALIDEPEIGGLIERVVVFGHPTLTRQVASLMHRRNVEVVVVDPHAGEHVDHYGPADRARVVRSASVVESYDPQRMRRWLGAWVVADRELRERLTTVHAPDLRAARETGYKERSAYARAEVAVKREAITRELLVESVWRASWPHDRLVLAASRLVRVLDGIAAPRRVEVRSNRGLAGIDGTVATALGVAVASQHSDTPKLSAGTTRVLIGDLALLHDAGSLLLPKSENRPRLQLFVGNDGGGTIFDTLEAAQTSSAEAFDRVMYTPQHVDLEALARAYGWDYWRISTRGELENLLTVPVTGPQIIEIPLAR